MEVKVKLEEGATMPTKGTSGAAAYDLYALEDTELHGGRQIIKTGVHMAMPHRLAAIIQGRSGHLSRGFEVMRAVFGRNDMYSCRIDAEVKVGLVDEDYRNGVGVMLDVNDPCAVPTYIQKGQRIAQMRFVEVPDTEFVEVDDLDETERGNKGFGDGSKALDEKKAVKRPAARRVAKR